jgi:hypothetical protein
MKKKVQKSNGSNKSKGSVVTAEESRFGRVEAVCAGPPPEQREHCAKEWHIDLQTVTLTVKASRVRMCGVAIQRKRSKMHTRQRSEVRRRIGICPCFGGLNEAGGKKTQFRDGRPGPKARARPAQPSLIIH